MKNRRMVFAIVIVSALIGVYSRDSENSRVADFFVKDNTVFLYGK